jgi:hypothetical protein
MYILSYLFSCRIPSVPRLTSQIPANAPSPCSSRRHLENPTTNQTTIGGPHLIPLKQRAYKSTPIANLHYCPISPAFYHQCLPSVYYTTNAQHSSLTPNIHTVSAPYHPPCHVVVSQSAIRLILPAPSVHPSYLSAIPMHDTFNAYHASTYATRPPIKPIQP